MSVLKSVVLEAFAEVTADVKEKTIVISQSSNSAAFQLMNRVGVSSTEDKTYPHVAQNFNRFEWPADQTEKQATPAALAHFARELEEFVKLGEKGYQLFDTHNQNNLLNVESSRVGKISGGTDAVIAPLRTAADTVTKCACVIFELKKNLFKSSSPKKGKCNNLDVLTETVSEMSMNDTNNMDTSNIPDAYPQLVTEAVAAALISNQPVLSILTDLHSDSNVALTLLYNRDMDTYCVDRYLNLTLSQMAHFVAQFLSENCEPRVHYITKVESESPHPIQEVVCRIKKKCLFNETSLAWEHFYDHFPDTAVYSSDRAQVVEDLFHSCGHHSNYAHMYT